MPIDDALLLGSTVSVVSLALFLLISSPVPRARVMIGTALAVLVPLALLSGYAILGYRTWKWTPFGYGSSIPWLLAGVLFAVMLWWVLFRSSVSRRAKVAIAALGGVSWFLLSLTAWLYIACGSGDCF